MLLLLLLLLAVLVGVGAGGKIAALVGPAPPSPSPSPSRKKFRLDELLVRRGIAESPKLAGAMVLAGDVFLNQDQRLTSAAVKLPEDALLRVKQRKGHPYASRGGLKLDHAIQHFGVENEILDAVAIDVGSSTGGFTDVLLQRGARRVYAVDVGYNLLDYRLRTDERVVVLERTNARHLSSALVPDSPVDVIVCDASFISLETVLPAALQLARPGAVLICLVKPQFEATREEVQPGGLISSSEVHQRVQEEAMAWLSAQPEWTCQGMVESPIRGAESGNLEFLMLGSKGTSSQQ
jgi:23S rRNA (cytidine1920-2'-O)/16S rRNA (cytidine1409-2'-O)-methyltransferase